MADGSLAQHPFFKTLVYANVYIALCAFAQVFLTYLVFDIPYNFDTVSYLAFVPLATYVQYNMQRGYMINYYNLNSERAAWLKKNRKLMLYSNFAGLGVLLFLCNSLSWTSIIIMVAAELVSSLYYLPPFNLRKYGYLKPFLIGVVWTVSTVVVPLIESHLLSENAFYFVAAQFLFITELCIVFDIKDAVEDFAGGVFTYANVFGVKFTKILSALMLAGSGICMWFFNNDVMFTLASLSTLLVTLLYTLRSSDEKHDFWFYLAIDGMLILQPLLFIFASLA